MRRIIIIITIILLLCFIIAGCGNTNKYTKNIKSDEITISYGKSIYESDGRLTQKTINRLIDAYSELEIYGTNTKELNYDKAVSIIFIYEGQITASVVIDPTGICHLDTNQNNLTYNTNNKLYDEGLKVYKELKEKYEE